MIPLVIDHWYDFVRGSVPTGEWVRLATPQQHCEGWGPPGGRAHGLDHTSHYCNGGTGLWSSTRARWVRWDGTLQCGTCHRFDVAAQVKSVGGGE